MPTLGRKTTRQLHVPPLPGALAVNACSSSGPAELLSSKNRRVAEFSKIFSFGAPSPFSIAGVKGLNAWPGWLVTTAMAVDGSWKIAEPPASENALHSGGTATWQAAFVSRISFQPDGTV